VEIGWPCSATRGKAGLVCRSVTEKIRESKGPVTGTLSGAEQSPWNRNDLVLTVILCPANSRLPGAFLPIQRQRPPGLNCPSSTPTPHMMIRGRTSRRTRGSSVLNLSAHPIEDRKGTGALTGNAPSLNLERDRTSLSAVMHIRPRPAAFAFANTIEAIVGRQLFRMTLLNPLIEK
jgi:hypothetical protein